MSKPLPVILEISKPEAFSGEGSIIIVELPDEDVAKRLASELARETGRRVTVRNDEMAIIDIVDAPATH